MSLIPLDDLLSKHLDDPVFVVGYLDECYRDAALYPGVFLSAVERVYRHAEKAFVDVASAMPYLRSLGFEPKNVARPAQKPAQLHTKRLPAPRAKTSVNAAAPR